MSTYIVYRTASYTVEAESRDDAIDTMIDLMTDATVEEPEPNDVSYDAEQATTGGRS